MPSQTAPQLVAWYQPGASRSGWLANKAEKQAVRFYSKTTEDGGRKLTVWRAASKAVWLASLA